jgi:uncharacterized protein YjbJ (UPF0337 family)
MEPLSVSVLLSRPTRSAKGIHQFNKRRFQEVNTMVNQQILQGNWNEVRGKLKEKWHKLADDDLRSFSGNVDQLVGQIQRKTGESRQAIEEFLGQVAGGASSAAENIRERVQEGMSGVRDRVQEGMSGMADTARQGYDALQQGYAEAERRVQERPGQSMAVAFGLGMLAGVGVALLFRERPSESAMARTRAAGEQLGRQLLDALNRVMPSR